MPKNDRDRLCNVIYFIVIVTWIICSLWNLNTNSTLLSKVKWKKCSITICLGLKWVLPRQVVPHLILRLGSKFEYKYLFVLSFIQVQFLKKAVDILCQCRQTLMYTYVFAFYLKKNNQSTIFEVRICIVRNRTLESLWISSRFSSDRSLEFNRIYVYS